MADLKKLRRTKQYAELKARYERAQRQRYKQRKTEIDFDEMIEQFASGIYSQADFARTWGVSKEAVRVRYDRYAKPLLGPWKVQSAYKHRTPRSLERDLKHEAWEETIARRHKPFAEYVASSSLPFSPITRLQGGRHWSRAKEVMVGNVHCRLIHSTRLWRQDPNDSPWIHFGVLSGDRHRDGIILIFEFERYPRRRFFFPISALEPPEKGQQSRYIPLEEGREYERQKPRYHYAYDFWLDYEEEKGIKALIELSEKLKGR